MALGLYTTVTVGGGKSAGAVDTVLVPVMTLAAASSVRRIAAPRRRGARPTLTRFRAQH